MVTDRWQKWTDLEVSEAAWRMYDVSFVIVGHNCHPKETLKELAEQCSEFLVHGVDVEGLQSGIEESQRIGQTGG